MSEPIELFLTEMLYGGAALGKAEGRPVFTAYGITGEHVTANITQDKGRFAFAQVADVLEAAEERVVPRCPHFGPGKCGGCHWQHIDYDAQLRFKGAIVAEQFRRIGGLPDVNVLPTLPSPDPWYYRSHVTLHTDPDGALGYIATDDRSVYPIQECHIIRPELLEMFNGLKDAPRERRERIRLMVGSAGGERLVVRGAGDEDDTPPAKPDTRKPSRPAKGDVVHYTVHGREFRVSGGSFFQVNLPQAEALVTLVLERLAGATVERALDLYAGVGLFTAFLAERAAHVTAIEVSPSAVQDAIANLAEFPNVTVFEGAIERVLRNLKGYHDTVLVDPPRAGINTKALDLLIERQPRRIVYVSCDPSTLARDAKRLVGAGYTLGDVQPVDMFPQTYHIETVTQFTL